MLVDATCTTESIVWDLKFGIECGSGSRGRLRAPNTRQKAVPPRRTPMKTRVIPNSHSTRRHQEQGWISMKSLKNLCEPYKTPKNWQKQKKQQKQNRCITTNTEDDTTENEKRHQKITLYTYALNITMAGTSRLSAASLKISAPAFTNVATEMNL